MIEETEDWIKEKLKRPLILEARHSLSLEITKALRSKLKASLFIPRSAMKYTGCSRYYFRPATERLHSIYAKSSQELQLDDLRNLQRKQKSKKAVNKPRKNPLVTDCSDSENKTRDQLVKLKRTKNTKTTKLRKQVGPATKNNDCRKKSINNVPNLLQKCFANPCEQNSVRNAAADGDTGATLSFPSNEPHNSSATYKVTLPAQTQPINLVSLANSRQLKSKAAKKFSTKQFLKNHIRNKRLSQDRIRAEILLKDIRISSKAYVDFIKEFGSKLQYDELCKALKKKMNERKAKSSKENQQDWQQEACYQKLLQEFERRFPAKQYSCRNNNAEKPLNATKAHLNNLPDNLENLQNNLPDTFVNNSIAAANSPLQCLRELENKFEFEEFSKAYKESYRQAGIIFEDSEILPEAYLKFLEEFANDVQTQQQQQHYASESIDEGQKALLKNEEAFVEASMEELTKNSKVFAETNLPEKTSSSCCNNWKNNLTNEHSLIADNYATNLSKESHSNEAIYDRVSNNNPQETSLNLSAESKFHITSSQPTAYQSISEEELQLCKIMRKKYAKRIPEITSAVLQGAQELPSEDYAKQLNIPAAITEKASNSDFKADQAVFKPTAKAGEDFQSQFINQLRTGLLQKASLDAADEQEEFSQNALQSSTAVTVNADTSLTEPNSGIVYVQQETSASYHNAEELHQPSTTSGSSQTNDPTTINIASEVDKTLPINIAQNHVKTIDISKGNSIASMMLREPYYSSYYCHTNSFENHLTHQNAEQQPLPQPQSHANAQIPLRRPLPVYPEASALNSQMLPNASNLSNQTVLHESNSINPEYYPEIQSIQYPQSSTNSINPQCHPDSTQRKHSSNTASYEEQSSTLNHNIIYKPNKAMQQRILETTNYQFPIRNEDAPLLQASVTNLRYPAPYMSAYPSSSSCQRNNDRNLYLNPSTQHYNMPENYSPKAAFVSHNHPTHYVPTSRHRTLPKTIHSAKCCKICNEKSKERKRKTLQLQTVPQMAQSARENPSFPFQGQTSHMQTFATRNTSQLPPTAPLPSHQPAASIVPHFNEQLYYENTSVPQSSSAVHTRAITQSDFPYEHPYFQSNSSHQPTFNSYGYQHLPTPSAMPRTAPRKPPPAYNYPSQHRIYQPQPIYTQYIDPYRMQLPINQSYGSHCTEICCNPAANPAYFLPAHNSLDFTAVNNSELQFYSNQALTPTSPVANPEYMHFNSEQPLSFSNSNETITGHTETTHSGNDLNSLYPVPAPNNVYYAKELPVPQWHRPSAVSWFPLTPPNDERLRTTTSFPVSSSIVPLQHHSHQHFQSTHSAAANAAPAHLSLNENG